MMTRKITIMALVVGILLGAAATEGFNVYRQSQDSYRRSHESQSFQQRVHCKAVADAYVKENTDLNDNGVTGTSVTLEKVDYSPARNSCVAELETVYFAPRGGTEFQSVQDLLSGETLFSVSNADDFYQHMFLPRVWDYVMNNASDPVELEKEWALMKSKNLPKAAPPPPDFIPADPPSLRLPKATAPASSIAEPNDWQTVQPSKSPPKSAPQGRNT